MKKIQYNYLPAGNETAGGIEKSKVSPVNSTKKVRVSHHNEDLLARLNAIGQEYPFCAWFKQRGTNLLF